MSPQLKLAIGIGYVCALVIGILGTMAATKQSPLKCEPKLIQFNADNTVNVVCIDVEQKHDTKKE